MENKKLSMSSGATPTSTQSAEALIANLKYFYEHFSSDTIARLDEIYTQDIEFTDPVHTFNGLLSVKSYLRKMARNVTGYRIEYVDTMIAEEEAYVRWYMHFSHPRLNGGKTVTLRGMSYLRFTSKVYYHEDSYDMGALLYEHVPLLGTVIRRLKQRLSGKS